MSGSSPLELTLQTLTPIWTGGVDATADRLHATGLIGSLRWWYEVIVRGLGGWACDPSSTDAPDLRCEFDTKAYQHAKDEKKASAEALKEGLKTVCPVCYLFGCGGWKRQFRLKVSASEFEPLCLATLDKPESLNHWWLSQIFKGGSLSSGTIHLQFWAEKPIEALINGQLKAVLSVMAHLGAIGAKTQYGFGQFDWAEKIELQNALKVVQEVLNSYHRTDKVNEQEWYSLSQLWFFEIILPENNQQLRRFSRAYPLFSAQLPKSYLPVSFDIRYKLPNSQDKEGFRQNYRMNYGKQTARKFFGTLEGEKTGSRVFVSHLFKRPPNTREYYLRVWGFTEDNVRQVVKDQLSVIFNSTNIPPPIIGSEVIQQSKQG